MLLDRHEQPVSICTDPACRWRDLPQAEHFDRHNPPCAAYFVATDGSEMLCSLFRGHEPPCRGTRRDPAS